jgi:hypothetical protein
LENFIAGIEMFREKYGHVNFPITQDRKPFEFEGFPMGRWANGYRSAFKDGSIRDWERERLNSIQGWIWDELDFKWNEGFAALRNFVAREGTSQVPQTHKEGNYPLGTWVARQRRIKNGSAQGTLKKEQIENLEAQPLGGWDAAKSKSLGKRNTKWEIYFRALEAYVKKQGTSRVPLSYEVDGLPLGRWVAYQKSAKAGKIKGSRISLEEIERLQILPGWEWQN